MLATSRIVVCAVAVLLAALAADAAKVNTIADTMERWGALGTWASDCRRAPEPGNSYLRFVRSGDRVVHERVYPGGRDAQDVQGAAVRADGMLDVVATFAAIGQIRKWTIAKGSDGRIRTLINSRVDGTDYTVRDGRFVHNGAETPWLTRCAAETI
jgi:hypothetical protein